MTLANRCEPDWQLLLHFHTEELSLHSRQTAHDARCTIQRVGVVLASGPNSGFLQTFRDIGDGRRLT
jgi:hypothetical protein